MFIFPRYLNEQLYTQTSTESAKMFKKDASLFSAYHQVCCSIVLEFQHSNHAMILNFAIGKYLEDLI